jgi:hypothetical protein
MEPISIRGQQETKNGRNINREGKLRVKEIANRNYDRTTRVEEDLDLISMAEI